VSPRVCEQDVVIIIPGLECVTRSGTYMSQILSRSLKLQVEWEIVNRITFITRDTSRATRSRGATLFDHVIS
jgi:hypothetical protein